MKKVIVKIEGAFYDLEDLTPQLKAKYAKEVEKALSKASVKELPKVKKGE